jgi:hypothetical protein
VAALTPSRADLEAKLVRCGHRKDTWTRGDLAHQSWLPSRCWRARHADDVAISISARPRRSIMDGERNCGLHA